MVCNYRRNQQRQSSTEPPSPQTPQQQQQQKNQANKENDSPLPKYKRDLVHKMKVLRQELQAMQPQAGHCRIEVSREEIFEVSCISKLSKHCKVC